MCTLITKKYLLVFKFIKKSLFGSWESKRYLNGLNKCISCSSFNPCFHYINCSILCIRRLGVYIIILNIYKEINIKRRAILIVFFGIQLCSKFYVYLFIISLCIYTPNPVTVFEDGSWTVSILIIFISSRCYPCSLILTAPYSLFRSH